jgi:mono/diheme cytochrome c family protein
MSKTLLVLAGLASVAAGCDHVRKPGFEYMPDMAHSLPYDSFAPNPVTRDGKTMQAPVAGTVPRGFLPVLYQPTPEDALRAGRELQNPLPLTEQNVSKGKVLYETFCLVCHGEQGRGDGPLVPRIPNPPAYSSKRVRDMAPGQIFHVITFGSGRMPPYAAQVSQDERWQIVRYVQILRETQAPKP